MAKRMSRATLNKPLARPKTLDELLAGRFPDHVQSVPRISAVFSLVLDEVSALECERDTLRAGVARIPTIQKEHEAAYLEVQRERNELRKALEATPQDSNAALVSMTAERDALALELDEACQKSDAKLEERAKEQEERIEKLEGERTELEEEVEALEKQIEALEKQIEEEDSDTAEERDALRRDLVEIARWIFSLGGTFADLSGLVGTDAHGLIQLAYLGGDHDGRFGEATVDSRLNSAQAGIFGSGGTAT